MSSTPCHCAHPVDHAFQVALSRHEDLAKHPSMRWLIFDLWAATRQALDLPVRGRDAPLLLENNATPGGLEANPDVCEPSHVREARKAVESAAKKRKAKKRT